MISDRKAYCLTCNNLGEVPCYCGGDICVCLESEGGMIPCPDCFGGSLIIEESQLGAMEE